MHGRMAYEAEKMKRLGPQDNTLIDFMWKLIGQPVFCMHACSVIVIWRPDI